MKVLRRFGSAAAGTSACCCFGLMLVVTATQALSGPRATAPARDVAAGVFEVREKPQRIRPFPVADVVADAELATILGNLEPRFDLTRISERLPVSLLVHATRLWGADVVFAGAPTPELDGKPLTGEYLVATLLSNVLYLKRSSMLGATLLAPSPYGIQAVTVLDSMSMSEETLPHQGQLLKVMADIGIRSSREVVAAHGHRGTLADVVRDDAARAFKDVELEFLVAGLSRYARPASPGPIASARPRPSTTSPAASCSNTEATGPAAGATSPTRWSCSCDPRSRST